MKKIISGFSDLRTLIDDEKKKSPEKKITKKDRLPV